VLTITAIISAREEEQKEKRNEAGVLSNGLLVYVSVCIRYQDGV
jgi:hypothetical protein